MLPGMLKHTWAASMATWMTLWGLQPLCCCRHYCCMSLLLLLLLSVLVRQVLLRMLLLLMLADKGLQSLTRNKSRVRL